MRKTLLTTTALAMGAGGIAAAQEAEPELGIALSGAAEMGIAGSKNDSTRFHTDIQATFTMSGATDGGLTYGTAIDLSEVSDEVDGTDHATGNDDAHGGIAINIAGPFGTLTMGDTDGAFDWALTETAVGGSLRDNHTGHPGYNGNSGLDGQHDGQILSYTHSIGGIGIAVSAELDDEIKNAGGNGSTIFGVGAKYSMPMGGGTVGFGLGYQAGKQTDTDVSGYVLSKAGQDALAALAAGQTLGPDHALIRGYQGKNRYIQSDTMRVIGASVNVDTGTGLSAIVNWSRKDHDGIDMDSGPADFTSEKSVTHFGVGGAYKAGPVTLGLNYGISTTEGEFRRIPSPSTGPDVLMSEDESTGFGLAANYDLGGGAVLQLGIGDGTTDMTRPDTSLEMDNDGEPDTDSTDYNTWSLGLAFSF